MSRLRAMAGAVPQAAGSLRLAQHLLQKALPSLPGAACRLALGQRRPVPSPLPCWPRALLLAPGKGAEHRCPRVSLRLPRSSWGLWGGGLGCGASRRDALALLWLCTSKPTLATRCRGRVPLGALVLIRDEKMTGGRLKDNSNPGGCRRGQVLSRAVGPSAEDRQQRGDAALNTQQAAHAVGVLQKPQLSVAQLLEGISDLSLVQAIRGKF